MLCANRVRRTAYLGALVLCLGVANIAWATTNQPPVPDPQLVDTNEDSPAPITLSATDPEGDPLTFAIWSPPANGTLSGACPNLVYTPYPDFAGVDVFTFKVKDPTSAYQFADVTITVRGVNDAPSAEPQSVSTSEDAAVSVMLIGSDLENDPLSFILDSLPVNGTVALSGNIATYVPNPDFFGTDTFKFKTDDGSLRSGRATVTIAVNPVNDPPVAADDAVAASSGASVTFDVTANDRDVEGDPLTVTVASASSRGVVNCSASGSCTYISSSGFSGTDTFAYVISDGQATDTAVVTVTVTRCPLPVSSTAPGDGASNVPVSGVLVWSSARADSYDVFLGPTGSGCQTLAGSTSSLLWSYGGLSEGATYEWRVVANRAGCSAATSSCMTFGTESRCNAEAPEILAPIQRVKVASPVTLRWNAAASALRYHVYAGFGGKPPVFVATTTGTSHTMEAQPGAAEWFVDAEFANCGPTSSARGFFDVAAECNEIIRAEDLIPSVVGEVTTGEKYRVSWTSPVEGLSFELQEATDASFKDATSQAVDGTSAGFSHLVHGAAPYFYRVKPLIKDCKDIGFSATVRVVVTPVSAPGDPNPRAVAQAGSAATIVQPIFISASSVAGKTASDTSYVAATDKSWMTVTPAAGTIPPSGATLIVTSDPTKMPIGSSIGTVNVTSPSGGSIAAVPVSISLVQPVSPVPRTSSPQHSLIIPTAAHVEGLNSSWRSDVRIANVSEERLDYELYWTGANSDATWSGKRTGFSLNGGQTMALDDIIRQWFGLGALSDGTNGVLEVRQVPKSGSAPHASATVGSSRLFNVTEKGTMGQFVPAIPISRFIGKSGALSLQALSRANGMRTNVGILEGLGQPATVQLTVFGTDGQKLDEFTTELKPGELRQFDNLLVSRGITALDARIEVRVLSESGRVHAYASVIDGASGDPFLVTGVDLSAPPAGRYVIPGATDFANGQNNWATDVQIFNNSAVPATLTATFYPQDKPESGVSREIPVGAHEVKSIDSVVSSMFGMKDATGAIHLTSAAGSSVIATARTYDRRPDGTYGQFIPAVEAGEAVGTSDRPLQILQVEESDRMRTNIGIAEVIGQSARVRVTAIQPETATAPVLTFDLKPYEFKQIPVLKSLKLHGAYNVRVTVEVISGGGKVVAYGSMVDNESQDPTYVPAQ